MKGIGLTQERENIFGPTYKRVSELIDEDFIMPKMSKG